MDKNNRLFEHCTKHDDILICMSQRNKRKTCRLKTKIKARKISKVIPKYSLNTYHFQGPINFPHLCEEARQSGKFAFLAISDNKLYFGFSRQVPDTLVLKYKKDFLAGRIHDTYLPFHVFTCKKNYTTLLMDRLKNIPKEVKKNRRKVAKKLYKDKVKGEFSNKPSTKIMVF